MSWNSLNIGWYKPTDSAWKSYGWPLKTVCLVVLIVIWYFRAIRNRRAITNSQNVDVTGLGVTISKPDHTVRKFWFSPLTKLVEGLFSSSFCFLDPKFVAARERNWEQGKKDEFEITPGTWTSNTSLLPSSRDAALALPSWYEKLLQYSNITSFPITANKSTEWCVTGVLPLVTCAGVWSRDLTLFGYGRDCRKGFFTVQIAWGKLSFFLIGISWSTPSDHILSHLRTTTHIIIQKYLLLSGPFDHAFGHGELSLQTCINGFEDGSREVGIIMKKSNIDIQSNLLSLLFFLEFVNAVLERSLRQNLIRVLFIFVLLFWNSWGDWFNRGGGSGRSV